MVRDTACYSCGEGTAIRRVRCKERKADHKSSCRCCGRNGSGSEPNMVDNLLNKAPDTDENTQGFVGICGCMLCAGDLDSIYSKFPGKDGHISRWCYI